MVSARILLVEDDDLLRELYEIKLRREGFEVGIATNGQEGLAKADEFLPDIILLDMMMPVMTGLEFLRTYQRPHPTTILVLSNKSTIDEIKEAKQLGASDYLVKSNFTPEDIVTEIRKYHAQKKDET